MNNFSSLSHSYNVDICCLYGLEEAVLIHHFQYWISHNLNLKRNFHDGRTWSFQTHAEISAHFPYWTPDKIRRYLDSLVEKGVIIKGNFNKTPFDRTIWYAFRDEEKFLSNGNSNIPNERLIRQIQPADEPNPNVQLATPIPDNIPYTKTKEIPAPSAPCSHPEAGNVSLLFSEAIKKTKPDIKEPAFISTQKIFDKLLRIDKRKIEIIKKLIEWLPTHNFWSTKILSAESFRRNFDKLELEMNQNRSKQCLNDPGLINKIKEHVHSIPTHKVIVGQNYVEFPEFRDAYFKVGDPRFKENISHHFYKIGYPLEEDK
jgi:hypothetical protein